MASYDDIARRWIQHQLGYPNVSQPRSGRSHHNSRLYADGDGSTIYSFGSHFPVARFLKNRTVLFNGDRWGGVVTPRHQAAVRAAVAGQNVPMVIIPFEALNGAGIDHGSVEIVDVSPDRNLIIEHESAKAPRHLEYVELTEYEEVGWSEEEMARWNEWHDWAKHAKEIDEARATVERGMAVWVEACTSEEPLPSYRMYAIENLPRDYAKLCELENGEPEWLGEPNGWIGHRSIYRPEPPKKLEAVGQVAGYVSRRPASKHRTASWAITGTVDCMTRVHGIKPRTEIHFPDEDGMWRWTTTRHILGESVIKADVPTTIKVTCKDCAGTGLDIGGDRLPDLPSRDERRQDGMYVIHRWDYNATIERRRKVPVPYAGPIEYAEWRRTDENKYQHADELWAEHTDMPYILPLPKEHYPCRGCYGARKVTKRIKRRGVYFLSGFDHNENHLAYFLSELPRKARPTTVDEAYESLKPEAVSIAEADGRDVKRQGDIFAIPTTLTDEQAYALAKRGGIGKRTETAAAKMLKLEPDAHQVFAHDGTRLGRPVKLYGLEKSAKIRKVTSVARLLTTNHVATEAIITKEGVTLARGILWHEPDGRSNDHARVPLGKEWHIIVANEAPRR